MLAGLATAHGWSAGAGSMSVLPVVGFVLGLTWLRVALRAPFGLGSIGASFVLGTLFWLLADAWGVTLALLGFAVSAGLVTLVVRSGRTGPSDRRPD